MRRRRWPCRLSPGHGRLSSARTGALRERQVADVHGLFRVGRATHRARPAAVAIADVAQQRSAGYAELHDSLVRELGVASPQLPWNGTDVEDPLDALEVRTHG